MQLNKLFKVSLFTWAFLLLPFIGNCRQDIPKPLDTSECGLAKPKNIIVMISDGCGYAQIDAASIYQYGKTGEQPYEKFPVRCAMSTYPAGKSYDPIQASQSFDYVRQGVTDSATAATAMSTGYKTDNGKIGVDTQNNYLQNVVERCEQLGKSTGVITTVPISHATPAGFVAHNKSRNNYEQIASEMINDSAVEVIMGAGHPLYDDDGKKNILADSYKYIGGKETYKALLAGTAGADADGDGISDPWKYFDKRGDFIKLAKGKTPKRVIAIARVESTLQEKRDGDDKAGAYQVAMNQNVPTLEEMTKAALNILDNDPDGLFLMIEGGAVDWACHANQYGRLLEEEIDFNTSVKAVIEWVNKNNSWDDTLLIVTGDHETGYLVYDKFNCPDHTNQLIPFFAKGAGSDLFIAAQIHTDPKTGPYIDNTDIAKTIFTLLKQTSH